jgi:hypothetical protein
MKTSLLVFVLIFFVLSVAAQDKTSTPVIVFSAIGFDFAHASSRNVTADVSQGESSAWGINTGVMYGKWKENTLLYYGLSFGLSGNSNSNNQKTNLFSVAPRIGLMKKVPITSSFYLMPSVEYFLGYGKQKSSANGLDVENLNIMSTGVLAYPLSLGVAATRKLDVVLTVGTLGMDYVRKVEPGKPSVGEPKIVQSTFSFSGQLGSLGVRLLMKI